MDTTLLEEIGLSKNEAAAYLALLELGKATAGEIAKQAKLYRSNTYETIERLVKRGLISYTLREKVKVFQAAPPESLLQFLEEKERKLREELPKLTIMRQLANSNGEVGVYEGVPAVRHLFKQILACNAPIDVYGLPRTFHHLAPFLTQFHRERIRRKIRMRHIYNPDAVERITFLRQLPYTEVRTLPEEYNSPVATFICGDMVWLALWSTAPLSIIIRNKEIAETYYKYFRLLWELAKE